MIDLPTFLIFGFCAGGIGYSCFKEGTKQGAEQALNILHQKKIICFDNRGNIKPNPFFEE